VSEAFSAPREVEPLARRRQVLAEGCQRLDAADVRHSEGVIGGIPLTKTTFTSLINPAGNSDRAIEMTFGFNWYLTTWARMQFNWEHAWFADPVWLGPGPSGLLRHQSTLGTRLQVIF
jgi:hypothetical protein